MLYFFSRPRCLAGALLGAVTLCLPAQAPAAAHAPGAPQATCPATPRMAMPPGKPAAANLVDINCASRPALRKLPGVTDAVARRIIAGRPYLSKAKLVSRHVISMDLFQQIRGLIVVNPQPEPKS